MRCGRSPPLVVGRCYCCHCCCRPQLTGHDAAVLWRSLREATPLSAAFTGSVRVRLNYPRHQELRAWPSFEALVDVRAEPAPLPHGELAGQIIQAQGGHVEDICMGPAGVAAVVWTPQSYPSWYQVVIWSGSAQAMTSPQVRIWGNPCWSLTGELAVTAFDGIRWGIVTIDPSDGTTGGGPGPPRQVTGCSPWLPAARTHWLSAAIMMARPGWSGRFPAAPISACSCCAAPIRSRSAWSPGCMMRSPWKDC